MFFRSYVRVPSPNKSLGQMLYVIMCCTISSTSDSRRLYVSPTTLGRTLSGRGTSLAGSKPSNSRRGPLGWGKAYEHPTFDNCIPTQDCVAMAAMSGRGMTLPPGRCQRGPTRARLPQFTPNASMLLFRQRNSTCVNCGPRP